MICPVGKIIPRVFRFPQEMKVLFMRVIPGFVLREIAGETIAVPSGEAAHCLSGLVILNDSGKFLFELLQQERSVAELVNAMTRTYEVDEATAQEDIAEFLALLRAHERLIDVPRQM